MKLLLKADGLVDGTGADPIPNGAALIEDGRIVQVGVRERVDIAPSEETDVIEVSGGSIMPGFVGMHTHIHRSAEADAYCRVTTESDSTLLMRGVQAVRYSVVSP